MILWGNSLSSNSVFKIQKGLIRTVMNTIHCLYSQYIFSLLTFVVKIIDTFKSNTAIHSINTRQGFDLRLPKQI